MGKHGVKRGHGLHPVRRLPAAEVCFQGEERVHETGSTRVKTPGKIRLVAGLAAVALRGVACGGNDEDTAATYMTVTMTPMSYSRRA